MNKENPKFESNLSQPRLRRGAQQLVSGVINVVGELAVHRPRQIIYDAVEEKLTDEQIRHALRGGDPHDFYPKTTILKQANKPENR